MTADKLTTEAAQKLAKLGAQKGGRARANVLTPEERSDIARKAVQARWAKAKAATDSKIDVWQALEPEVRTPKALYSGKIRIAATSLACHVLDDWKRVISKIVTSLTGHFEGGLDRFLDTDDLKPFARRLKVADRRVDFLIQPQSTGERIQRTTRHSVGGDLRPNGRTSSGTARAVDRQKLII